MSIYFTIAGAASLLALAAALVRARRREQARRLHGRRPDSDAGMFV